MRLIFPAIALMASACATSSTRGVATWDDVAGEPDVVRASVAAPRATRHPPAATAIDTSAPADDDATAGMLIDRALVTFTNERALAKYQGPNSLLWSRAWHDALTAIDVAVTRAPVASDLGAFVRVRVTIDVELVTDRRRGAALPNDLDERIYKTLLGVDESVQELRAANAPGTTIGVTPRLHDGDLVLRAPLSPMVISSPFGKRLDPFTNAVRYHSGVDLDAETGAAIYAAASGIVVYAGPQGGYGNYVVLDHGDGVRSHYAHCQKVNTTVGALVIEGDVIAFVGSTGRSTGPHLHFAVTDDLGAFLDPIAVLDIPFDALRDQVAAKPGKAPPPPPPQG